MKLAIGSDKSGFAVKEAVKAYLSGTEHEVDDLGTVDLEAVHPYYQVASEVAPRVQDGTYDRAILICGTGAGMSVVANKFKGVYDSRASMPSPARAFTLPRWRAPSTTRTSFVWAAGSSDRKWPLSWSRPS